MAVKRWAYVAFAAAAGTALWLLARDSATALVGALARALVALAGYEAPDVGEGALAIVLARTAEGAIVRGTTLERWHVNLIALPALVVAFGPRSPRRRLALAAGAFALVLLLDALSAVAFVALQGSADPELRGAAMRALAVYGSKVIPLVVWVGLCWTFASRTEGNMERAPREGQGRRAVSVAPGIFAALLLLAADARAAILTVTGTGDTIAVDGFVTLREAITAANTNMASGDAPAGSGTDTINFNIAGLPGTVFTITPNSALPTITAPVIINGYSQLGASANTLLDGTNAFLAIELNGTNAGFQAGLAISAGNSTVSGLIINRFSNEGILVLTNGGNVIRGNFIGTDSTGKLDRGNGVTGVALLSANNVVGGTTPADANLLSGNGFGGVSILNVGSSGNRIEGNYIGTDDTGSAALANSGDGVRIVSAPGNTVGGTAAGTRNVVAFNTGSGVEVVNDTAIGNEILGNHIHDNGELGIDLAADGVTANDPLDADVGPNARQNFPAMTAAVDHPGGTTLIGTLDAAASTTYRVELFTNPACDPTGSGESAVFLGADDVLTSPTGHAPIVFESPAKLDLGAAVTATATDPAGNTSELSGCALVGVPVPIFDRVGLAAAIVLLALAGLAGQRRLARRAMSGA
jgi:hypothetical protein